MFYGGIYITDLNRPPDTALLSNIGSAEQVLRFPQERFQDWRNNGPGHRDQRSRLNIFCAVTARV